MAVNTCLKYLLFFINLLFCISGCFILVVSIYLRVSSRNVIMGTIPGVNLLIAAGVIIMLLGFLGCCGAIQENRVMLMLLFVVLMLLFVLLLIAGILAAVQANASDESMKKWIESMLPLSNQTLEFQADLQKFEEQEKCCGLLNGPSDWGQRVPTSCECQNRTQECRLLHGRQVYPRPCVSVLTSIMVKDLLVILSIAFGITVLIIFEMTVSMILYCQVGKNGYVSK